MDLEKIEESLNKILEECEEYADKLGCSTREVIMTLLSMDEVKSRIDMLEEYSNHV